jgi:hypothetical protein
MKKMKITNHITNKSSIFARAFAAALLALVLTINAHAEWTTDGNITTFTDQVGFSEDGAMYSGIVSLRMESILVSGQSKILTTIVDVEPAPGFTYTIKKSGGINGTVEIEFNSPTCSSRFSFLYKPGSTKIDYGVMRCR